MNNETISILWQFEDLACAWSENNEHSRNILGVHGFHILTVTLLTETHTGTPIGLKKPFTLDFTPAISIGIAELKFQKGGCKPTIKQHNSRLVLQRTREGTASSQNKEDRNPPIINHSEDRNAPITDSHSAAYNDTANRHHHLMKTSSKQSKHCDPHPCDNIVRQTINKLLFPTLN